MDFSALLHGNQVFTGMAGAAIMGYVLVQIRALPKQLWELILNQFTVEVTIFNDEPAFYAINCWLSKHPMARKTRNSTVIETYDAKKDTTVFDLSPGAGRHLITEGGKRFILTRKIDEKIDTQSGRRGQSIHMRTWGRDTSVLRNILDVARHLNDRLDGVPVLMWGQMAYRTLQQRLTRTLDTVYIDDKIKTDLVDDIEKFLDRRQWYADRGIPYRRGYLLKGSPGTGKSSLIAALAVRFAKPLFIINLSTIRDDNALNEALSEVGNGFVAIEDIDAFKVGAKRKKPDTSLTSGGSTSQEEGITLSGLLNAIDGLAAGDGRVLFFTSNHAGVLDEALLRPGRADIHIDIGPIHEPQARQMFRVFHPGENEEAFAALIRQHLPMPAADLQGYLLSGTFPEETREAA